MAAPTATKRLFCAEAWDGRTVRWVDGRMLLVGEGFACARKHYDKLARDRERERRAQ
jgi:hypothetical protein